jgi:hypothetical protein
VEKVEHEVEGVENQDKAKREENGRWKMEGEVNKRANHENGTK